jgi:hypothetical protein
MFLGLAKESAKYEALEGVPIKVLIEYPLRRLSGRKVVDLTAPCRSWGNVEI